MKSVSFGDIQDNKTEKIAHCSPMNYSGSPPLMRFGSEAGAPSFKLRSSNQSIGIFYKDNSEDGNISEENSDSKCKIC